MVIQSRKPVVIVGQSVTFEAPVVDIQAPTGEVVMAQGQPGGSQASLMMSSRYDMLAMAHTQAEGRKQVVHSPPIDIPQPGKFDLGGLVGNVLAGIAVAACVGAAVAASMLFFPAVIAAVAGTAVASSAVTAAYVIGGLTALAGSAAAIGTGLEDIANGQVRDQTVYQNNAYQVAVTTGGVLQTLYGAYDLAKFVTQVPNILNNFGKFLFSFGNSGSGGMCPALAGAGANGGMFVIGGTVEVGAVLTGEQLSGLAQGLGLTNAASIMLVKRAGMIGVHGSHFGKETGSGIPVKEKILAKNGLYYQSNPKHTPGQRGSKRDAGVEPKNSLELFENSVPSSEKPNVRFTYDRETKTLHRFFNDNQGVWHWSGSTNQGANSLTAKQIPKDIKNFFNLPKKGW